MYLITLGLEKLGDGCIVKNSNGAEFLDLSKVRCLTKGYEDALELKFIVKHTRRLTKTGKKVMSVEESQSEDERLANAKPVYIGGGIQLFESSGFQDQPAKSYTSTELPAFDTNSGGLPL